MAKQLTKEEFLEEVSAGYQDTGLKGIYKLNGGEIGKLRESRLWAHHVSGNAYLVIDDNANPVTFDQVKKVLG